MERLTALRIRAYERTPTMSSRPKPPIQESPAASAARTVILEAAAALLDEGGPGGLTIRRLALRSGFTAPAIYQHFGDKAGLLDALLDLAFQGLVERLRMLPEPPDVLERMRIQFREIVRFGREHPTHWRLMEALRDEQPPVPAAEEARERLQEPLDGLAQAGRLRVDVESVRQSLWALIHGLIALPTSRPDVEWRDGLADVAFEAMLAGLVKEAPAEYHP